MPSGTHPPHEGPRRGRSPTHSRGEVVAAAIALADRDGLDAVTMRAVARTLDTGPASLYRHVADRDDLVALMADEVNGEFDLAAPADHSWVDRMTALARQARTIYRRHPWLIEALDSTPPLGPNGCAYLDHALAVLAPTGADSRTMLEGIAVVSGLVRMLAKQERDRPSTDRAAGAEQTALATHLASHASSGRYPHLAAALGDAPPAEDQFERILRRVISGLFPSRDGSGPRPTLEP